VLQPLPLLPHARHRPPLLHAGCSAPPSPLVELIPAASRHRSSSSSTHQWPRSSSFVGPAHPCRSPSLVLLLLRWLSSSPLVLLLLRTSTARLLLLDRASLSPPLLSLPLATRRTVGPPSWIRGEERIVEFPHSSRSSRLIPVNVCPHASVVVGTIVPRQHELYACKARYDAHKR
jgi:hypothetical protein